MRPQREAVLKYGSAQEILLLVKQGEGRLALIAERMKDTVRQAEMRRGKMSIAVEQFKLDAKRLWPRLDVKATLERNYYMNDQSTVRVVARVKGEKKICYQAREPLIEFPTEFTQAMLGLIG